MNSNEIVVSLSGVAISANKMQSKKRLEKNIIWESNELDRSKCQLKCKIRRKKRNQKTNNKRGNDKKSHQWPGHRVNLFSVLFHHWKQNVKGHGQDFDQTNCFRF